MRLVISNALHAAAHRIDPQPCRCHVGRYMDGWRAHQEMMRKGRTLPASPDQLDAWFRSLIADSERPVA